MRHRDAAIPGCRPRAGFATAVVLGLVAVAAVLCAGALHDALFGEQLATSRMLHQRASGLAELGLQQAMARLEREAPATEVRFALQPDATTNESVGVSLRNIGIVTLPSGFSAGRIAAQHFEIESTGMVARGIRATQVQGAVRLAPVLPAAVEPGP